MIVVAIIGILAAVAVPGFMRYIKDSKTAEAKDNLKAIADGALTYFESEHDYDGAGMHPQSRLYPGQTSSKKYAAHTGTCPSDGDPSSADQTGLKHDPTDAATTGQLSIDPFLSLKFVINKPYYYTYKYGSSGTVAGSSKFGATAGAGLSVPNDSYFFINGTTDGKVGNITACDEGKVGSIASGVASCAAAGNGG